MTEYVSSRSMSTRYPVEVIRSDRRNKTVSARIVAGVIRVRIPSWMSVDDERRFVAEAVDKIERRRQSDAIDLEARARGLAERFDLPRPAAVRWVSNQHQRWGSCTVATAEIRISDRLVAAPPWVLDHVIVHELVHLVVADHSPAFHELLSVTERRDGVDLGRGLDYYERQYAALNAGRPGAMRLYTARYEGELLAAHTMITAPDGQRVWYQTGA